MTEREYRAAFTYLDYANFTREVGEIGEKRRRATVLEIPRTAWYKRPECWAIIMGSISLMHGLFVQWVWPQIQTTLPANPPKAPRPLPAHPSTTRRWA
ncbi:hypothetical protein GGS21DRAFT_509853 [Xylaria nigripes]|nr:hypothetical protein GGS21DRAFT_509853 [Xylaria nigripes]